MKTIKEVVSDIEHIPKCPISGEVNLYYLIKYLYGTNKNNQT